MWLQSLKYSSRVWQMLYNFAGCLIILVGWCKFSAQSLFELKAAFCHCFRKYYSCGARYFFPFIYYFWFISVRNISIVLPAIVDSSHICHKLWFYLFVCLFFIVICLQCKSIGSKWLRINKFKSEDPREKQCSDVHYQWHIHLGFTHRLSLQFLIFYSCIINILLQQHWCLRWHFYSVR